jgi:hypothetical protein
MEKKLISATYKPGTPEEKKAEVEIEWGETTEESAKAYGDGVVNSNSFANIRVIVQSGIRRALAAGKTPEEIKSLFKNWKPGTVSIKGDPMASAMQKFNTMTKDEQKKYIEELRKLAAGKAMETGANK